MRSAIDVGTPREGDQQCLVRDANEAIERSNVATRIVDRQRLRCECGDPRCVAEIAPTHAEYEDVRAYGSRFLISVDHENPETACVLSENARYAVVDVLAGDARHTAMVRNPRHAWVDDDAADAARSRSR